VGNRANRRNDLFGDEAQRTQRRFVIEEDAVQGMYAESFPEINAPPMRGPLGNGIGAARMEWRRLVGGTACGVAKALARACVVKPGVMTDEAYRLEQVQAARDDAGHRLDRLLK